jgi:hypothetical protein
MSLAESIAIEIAKKVLERLSKAPSSVKHEGWSVDRLKTHLIEVANWSGRIEFFGLGTAKATDSDTVGLFSAIPRKFRSDIESPDMNTEEILLTAKGHYLVLGDPGAGKTTTLKRLARRILLQDPTSEFDTAQYPIVIRLREVNSSALLEELLARALRLNTRREVRRRSERQSKARHAISSTELEAVLVGKDPAIDVIAETINKSNALLLLDGLDEIQPELRQRTENSVVHLARKCEGARLILSCRSGDYNRSIAGFDSVEICPLDSGQIRQIVDRWSSRPDDFMSALARLPFGDLANRPLFLCELILLFEKRGFIPSQPASVYRRVILLALEEWDAQKGLHRRSQYSNFDPECKLEFLANLAFLLTFELEAKALTSKTLEDLYHDIRDNFDLPAGEAQEVIGELETHTGIIVEAGFDQWEFSHLSIQEYLAAHYLVRDQITRDSGRYMLINPAPFAISVAISAHPTRRLAAILLASWNGAAFPEYNFASFFSRLLQDRPAFKADPILGFVALALIFSITKRSEYVEEFLNLAAVRISTAAALKSYVVQHITGQGQEQYRLRLRSSAQPEDRLVLPKGGILPDRMFETLLSDLELRLQESTPFFDDESGAVFLVVGRDVVQ